MMIEYSETNGFKKDFKKLSKKFKTLATDLDVAKKYVIELFHLNNIDNQSVVQVPGYANDFYQIYKLRKFACKALKGRGSKSGIRIIYAYYVKISKVTFIEMYFKADQANADTKRVKEFIKQQKI
ncbi:MAG: hypothetical protein PVG30_01640 [Gammaproteobacteria bacterium]|jgi:hypothetical protein